MEWNERLNGLAASETSQSAENAAVGPEKTTQTESETESKKERERSQSNLTF